MIRETFEEHLRVATDSLAVLSGPLTDAIEATIGCHRSHGRVLTCGNGGSAAQAQHLAAELVGRFERDREAVAAVALGADTATMTAIGNDVGFEHIFSRQLEALARPGDVFIGITTSGTSPNVVAAFDTARRLGCTTVALTGAGGGQLVDRADVLVAVPSSRVARIQEIHMLCLHVLCAAVEEALG